MELHQRKTTNHSNHINNHYDAPSIISTPKSSWSLPCKIAYFIAALSKRVLKNTQHLTRIVARSPSYIVVDVDVQATSTSYFPIDRQTLTSLTRDKNLDLLSQPGGVNHLALTLGTNNALGVSSTNTTDLSRRKTVYGSNVFQKPPIKTFLSFVIQALKDTTIIILLLSACLSLGFGMKQHGLEEGWYDGGSIILAISLVAAISAISNFKQSQWFTKHSNISRDVQAVQVLRDGRRQHVPIFEVVVGYIVLLNKGDQIPADGLFLDANSLKVDESSLTGESDHVEVNDKNNPFLFFGTKVTDGGGRMLVTSVGINTSWGEMMSSIRWDLEEETPLQKRLNKLTLNIVKVGIVVASLALLVLLVRYFTGHTRDEHGIREFNGRKTRQSHVRTAVLDMVSAAVTIVLVVVPGSLPLAVTLTLAYSVKKMVRDNAMVKSLSAYETMGSVTTICTDKTGTLTLNQMSVSEFWQGKEVVQRPLSLSENVQELLHQAVGLNTTGSVCQIPSESIPKISGSPTEKAILEWAVHELGMKMDMLNNSFKVLKVEAFNSEKKRRGVMARMTSTNMVHLHRKGAAEMILAMCSNYYNQEGMPVRLEEEDKEYFLKIIQNMADKSLRCIAFAHKQGEEDGIMQQLDDGELTLLGIVGLKDPCRPGVLKAVESCRKARVNVKMITGDNIFTAKAIAKECGILKPDDLLHEEAVIEGIEFRNYSLEERMAKIDNIRVMARSTPLERLLMVQCLKQKGHVVAVAGNGTNDAPALKEADIGLLMGDRGTDVAKECSDVVILDNNFDYVVTILRWGRWIYNNIQKFIRLQLTANIAALVINFVTAIFSRNVPLTASQQLLWLNLIITVIGALALAIEERTEDLMEKDPVGKNEPLITKEVWRNLIVQAQMAALLTRSFWACQFLKQGINWTDIESYCVTLSKLVTCILLRVS